MTNSGWKSARNNFLERQQIREQLMEINYEGDLFFMLGQGEGNEPLFKDDLIFGNFIDTYNKGFKRFIKIKKKFLSNSANGLNFNR